MIWGILLLLTGLVSALAVWQVPSLDSKVLFYAIGGTIGGLYLIVTGSKSRR